MLLFRLSSLVLSGLTILTVPGSAQIAHQPPLPPAPILLHWPEPAFEPARQCQGQIGLQDLEQLLPHARLGLSLPGIRSVELNQERRCITVTVDDIGAGRLVELLLRGTAVPRHAVLLLLAGRPSA
jgi:hypothetical protein